MKLPITKVEKCQKVVLFFDICSSTSILDNLTQNECEQHWCRLLLGLKRFLERNCGKHQFEIYKFIGDGWILLFDPECCRGKILIFLENLDSLYLRLFKRHIARFLTRGIKGNGLTFGMEMGTLMLTRMSGGPEYLGKALNLAARLQDSIKQRDPNPASKVLCSKKVYEWLKPSLSGKYRVDSVIRKLRNISDGEKYPAKKLWLHSV